MFIKNKSVCNLGHILVEDANVQDGLYHQQLSTQIVRFRVPEYAQVRVYGA